MAILPTPTQPTQGFVSPDYRRRLGVFNTGGNPVVGGQPPGQMPPQGTAAYNNLLKGTGVGQRVVPGQEPANPP